MTRIVTQSLTGVESKENRGAEAEDIVVKGRDWPFGVYMESCYRDPSDIESSGPRRETNIYMHSCDRHDTTSYLMIQHMVTNNKALKVINTSLQKQTESIRDLTKNVQKLKVRITYSNQTRKLSQTRSQDRKGGQQNKIV
ncbi:hypothetical protein CHS0354_018215 [Potamilus streckersoni]|uniref:Uncharacterized protein n=1 Tax=Potamilus streckersoni TaxID=2493646 RepID=A0AAE0VJ57_9BIVA|nr:hypothetical protein CHS0354_018215 [Potamilus streckersoni]